MCQRDDTFQSEGRWVSMVSVFDQFPMDDSFPDQVARYLSEMEVYLNRLERAPDDFEALEEAYRRAHTIGGSASTMGFPSLSMVTFAMEDLLGDVLDEVLHLDKAVLDLLRRSLGRSCLIVQMIKTGTGDAERIVVEDVADHLAFRQQFDEGWH